MVWDGIIRGTVFGFKTIQQLVKKIEFLSSKLTKYLFIAYRNDGLIGWLIDYTYVLFRERERYWVRFVIYHEQGGDVIKTREV